MVFVFISAIRRGRPTKYSYLSRSSKSFTSQYDLITLLTQLERGSRASITAAPSSPTLESTPCHKIWTLFSAALKWTKHVPMFSNLDICEQYAMLRCCWGDLFILVAAQYDLQIDSVALSYEIETCAGMCNERKLRLKQTLASFHECLLRLRGLEEAEYACLKVMVLFSSGWYWKGCDFNPLRPKLLKTTFLPFQLRWHFASLMTICHLPFFGEHFYSIGAIQSVGAFHQIEINSNKVIWKNLNKNHWISTHQINHLYFITNTT